MTVKVHIVLLEDLEDKLNEIDYANVLNIIHGNYPSGQQYYIVIEQQSNI